MRRERPQHAPHALEREARHLGRAVVHAVREQELVRLQAPLHREERRPGGLPVLVRSLTQGTPPWGGPCKLQCYSGTRKV